MQKRKHCWVQFSRAEFVCKVRRKGRKRQTLAILRHLFGLISDFISTGTKETQHSFDYGCGHAEVKSNARNKKKYENGKGPMAANCCCCEINTQNPLQLARSLAADPKIKIKMNEFEMQTFFCVNLINENIFIWLTKWIHRFFLWFAALMTTISAACQ